MLPGSAPTSLSSEQNAVLADSLSVIARLVEELSDTPLSPEQHHVLYQLTDGIGRLRLLLGVGALNAPVAAGKSVENPGSMPRFCRILLLDRGRNLAGLIRESLAPVPHRLDHCGDRAQALAFFQRERYDLVLADPKLEPALPALLGAAAAVHGDASKTPVVAVEASAPRPPVVPVGPGTFDDRLPKPCSREELLTVLARYIPNALPDPVATPALGCVRREFLLKAQEAADGARDALVRCDRRGVLDCADFVSGMAAALGFRDLERAAARLRYVTANDDWRKAGQYIGEIAALAEIAGHAADTAV